MSGATAWTATAVMLGVLAGAVPAASIQLHAHSEWDGCDAAMWRPLVVPVWARFAVGACLGALLGVRFAHSAALPAYLVLAASAVPLSAVDLAQARIPDKILGPAVAAVALCFAGACITGDGFEPLLRAATAALAVGSAFFVLSLLAGGTFGLGDVKLLTYLAMLTGYQTWSTVLNGAFAGFAIAAAVALAARRRRSGSCLPLAPWLLTGVILALTL